MGGSKEGPKHGEVKYDWSQCGPLEKSISPCIRARVPVPKVVNLENVAEKSCQLCFKGEKNVFRIIPLLAETKLGRTANRVLSGKNNTVEQKWIWVSDYVS